METSKSRAGTGLMCPVREHPPVPADGQCQGCPTNKFRYRKDGKYLCKHCWDRSTYPELLGKTDEEIDKLREENIKKNTKKYEIVNTSNLGFR